MNRFNMTDTIPNLSSRTDNIGVIALVVQDAAETMRSSFGDITVVYAENNVFHFFTWRGQHNTFQYLGDSK